MERGTPFLWLVVLALVAVAYRVVFERVAVTVGREVLHGQA